MVDLSEFESISPYSDAEAAEALSKLAEYPVVTQVSQHFFPEESPDYLKNILKRVNTIDEFQTLVMQKVVRWVIDHTAHNFSYDGIANIPTDKKFLALSNHRDIILDPAITQLILKTNGFPMTEIAVGDNLITSKAIEYMIRSNRMIKVVRGISARELYLSSQLLSKYIRLNVTEGRSSIWLAQRQGRTKNGYDITEQGLLKMLDMSGTNDFQQNFEELNILPMSISYEIEPCDILKARELVISRKHKYVKKEGEDLNSILTGILQPKGRVHFQICKPLTEEDMMPFADLLSNDFNKHVASLVDQRVYAAYRLWPNNYIAHDILNSSDAYVAHYTPEQKNAFINHMSQLDEYAPSADLNELKTIFLKIYATPVDSAEAIERQ